MGILEKAWVSKLIMDVVDDVLAKSLVLPNRLTVNLAKDQGVDIAALSNPPPQGVLHVTVLAAHDLVGVDWKLLGARTSDPYCILRLGAGKHTTKTINANCSPRWENEVAVFF